MNLLRLALAAIERNLFRLRPVPFDRPLDLTIPTTTLWVNDIRRAQVEVTARRLSLPLPVDEPVYAQTLAAFRGVA